MENSNCMHQNNYSHYNNQEVTFSPERFDLEGTVEEFDCDAEDHVITHHHLVRHHHNILNEINVVHEHIFNHYDVVTQREKETHNYFTTHNTDYCNDHSGALPFNSCYSQSHSRNNDQSQRNHNSNLLRMNPFFGRQRNNY